MIYLILVQFYFESLVAGYSIDNEVSGRWYAEDLAPVSSSLILFALFMYFFLLDLLVFNIPLRSLANNKFFTKLRMSRNLGLLSVFILIAAFLHFLSRDPGLLFQNSTYLLLNSTGAVRRGLPFAELIGNAAAPFTFLSLALLAVALSAKNWMASLLLGVSCSWFLSFAIVCCSRTGAVGVVLFFISYGLITQRKILILAGLGTTAFLYLSIIALDGRGGGAFGFANLLQILRPKGEANVVDVICNLVQGAYVTTDGFLVPGKFKEEYKLLSLSPLPSIIDGFELIREQQEIRLSDFVPMSGITEIIRFGGLYTFSAAIIYGAIVLFVNSRKCLSVIGLAPTFVANLVISFYTIQAFSYPLRNSLRQIMYVGFVIFLFYLLRSRSTRSRLIMGGFGA
jgi:hypothetical protein